MAPFVPRQCPNAVQALAVFGGTATSLLSTTTFILLLSALVPLHHTLMGTRTHHKYRNKHLVSKTAHFEIRDLVRKMQQSM